MLNQEKFKNEVMYLSDRKGFYEKINPLLKEEFGQWLECIPSLNGKIILDPFSKTEEMKEYLYDIENCKRKWKFLKLNPETNQGFLLPKNKIIITNLVDFLDQLIYENENDFEQKIDELFEQILVDRDCCAIITRSTFKLNPKFKNKLFKKVSIGEEYFLLLFVKEAVLEKINSKNGELNNENIEEPDYDSLLEKEKEKNLKEYSEDLKNKAPYLMEKISKFSKKTGINKKVVYKILSNTKNPAYKILALQFYKDPSKQNFYERVCFDFIAKKIKVDSFRKLPQSGKEALFLNEGIVCNTKGDSKAIDFFAREKDIHIFVCSKYTKDSGGTQDHQKDEGVRFLKSGELNKDVNSYFIFLADGPYYQQIQKGKRIIDSINEKINSKRVFAMTTGEFIKFFNTIINGQ